MLFHIVNLLASNAPHPQPHPIHTQQCAKVTAAAHKSSAIEMNMACERPPSELMSFFVEKKRLSKFNNNMWGQSLYAL